jgi:WD40 repeat protein
MSDASVNASTVEMDGPPDVDQAGTRENFAQCLHQLQQWSGRSFREIARVSRKSNHSISWGTARNMVQGVGAPQERSVRGFLHGCGLSFTEHQRWVDKYIDLFSRPPVAGTPAVGTGWTWAGVQTQDHFSRRALGQRTHSRAGDLFRGRSAALAAVQHRLIGELHYGSPVVITGQPGAGKSTVLARIVLTLVAEGIGPGIAVHARGATFADVVAAIGAAAGTRSTDVDDLVQVLDQPRLSSLLVAVDALDEAASSADMRGIAELLNEIARLPSVRVVVATRPLSSGDPYAPGELLSTLGVVAEHSPNLVNLDIDTYVDVDGLGELAAAVLTQRTARHPAPAHAAWERYREDPELTDRLAGVIAKRAAGNYLVAALASTELSVADQVVDPDSDGFDPGRIPASVRDAINKYLETLPPADKIRIRAILTAVAYGRNGGIDDSRWLAFARALDYHVTAEDLDALRFSPAGDYLLESHLDDGTRVTRLFHEALAEELLRRRGNTRADQRSLLKTMLPDDAASWATADDYVRSHLAGHTAAAGQLPSLLNQPCFLAVADLDRLLPLLSSTTDAQLAPIVTVLRHASHRARVRAPQRRAQLLALTAAHLGLPHLVDRFAAVHPGRYVPLWAHSLADPHQQLLGFQHEVRALAVGRLGDRDVIVATGDGGEVRVWDQGGRQVGAPFARHENGLRAVVLGRLGKQDVIVAAADDGTVRVWDQHGLPFCEPLRGHNGAVHAVAAGRLGKQHVIVSGGEDGTVRVWDHRGLQIGDPLTGHRFGVQAVAVGRLGEREVIVSADGADCRVDQLAPIENGEWAWVHIPQEVSVRVWDDNGNQIGAPLTGHHQEVEALAVGAFGGRDVIISAGDGGIRVWDQHRHPVGDVLQIEPRGAGAIALGTVGHHDVLVIGTNDRIVQLRDEQLHLIGRPMRGHEQGVFAVAVGRLGRRDVIVSGSGYQDAAVRVWDQQTPSTGRPLTGHDITVGKLATGWLGGREIVVSACEYVDPTVRVWDQQGNPIGQPLTGHDDGVLGLAVGQLGDKDVIVSCGIDHTIRIWDQHQNLVCDPLTARSQPHAVTVGRIGGQDLIVAGGVDGAIEAWDQNGAPIAAFQSGQHRIVSVGIGKLAGRRVIISSSGDGTICVWDQNLQPIGDPLTGIPGEVHPAAIGQLAGRDIIVSGSDDGTIRAWDQNLQPIGDPLTGHDGWVHGIAIGRIANRDVIVSCGAGDLTIRIWDNTLTNTETLDVVEIPVAVALDSNHIYAATGMAICAWRAT